MDQTEFTTCLNSEQLITEDHEKQDKLYLRIKYYDQAWKFHYLRETIYRYQNIYSAETTERSFVSMESN